MYICKYIYYIVESSDLEGVLDRFDPLAYRWSYVYIHICMYVNIYDHLDPLAYRWSYVYIHICIYVNIYIYSGIYVNTYMYSGI